MHCMCPFHFTHFADKCMKTWEQNETTQKMNFSSSASTATKTQHSKQLHSLAKVCCFGTFHFSKSNCDLHSQLNFMRAQWAQHHSTEKRVTKQKLIHKQKNRKSISCAIHPLPTKCHGNCHFWTCWKCMFLRRCNIAVVSFTVPFVSISNLDIWVPVHHASTIRLP